MAVRKMKVVQVNMSGSLKMKILALTSEYDISKAQFIYEVEDFKIVIYGNQEGKAGQENKYEFPPPFDKNLFFNECYLVKYSSNDLNPQCLSIEEWTEIYNKLYGGFENLTDHDEEDEREIEEENQLLNNPTIKFTKEGYIKDDMVVDDDEDEDYIPPVNKKKSNKQKLRKTKEVNSVNHFEIPQPVEVKKRVKKTTTELPVSLSDKMAMPSQSQNLEQEIILNTKLQVETPKTSETSETPKTPKTSETPKIPKKKTSKAKKTQLEVTLELLPPAPPAPPSHSNSIELSNPVLTNEPIQEQPQVNTEKKKTPRVRKPKVVVPPLQLPLPPPTIMETLTETETPLVTTTNEEVKNTKTQKNPRTRKPITKKILEVSQPIIEIPTSTTKNPKEPKSKKSTNKQKKMEDSTIESHLTCENELIEEQYV